jgi:hypothetical protein
MQITIYSADIRTRRSLANPPLKVNNLTLESLNGYKTLHRPD